VPSPITALKKKRDFKKVYNRGKHAAEPLFVVYALVNDLDDNRLGLSVSKKVGGAVVRNRVKRLIRECCRLMDLRAGYDFVVIARTPVGALPRKGSFSTVRESLGRLFGRLKLNKSAGDKLNRPTQVN